MTDKEKEFKLWKQARKEKSLNFNYVELIKDIILISLIILVVLKCFN